MNNISINPASFIGGNSGNWKIRRMETITGEILPTVPFIDFHPTHTPPVNLESTRWILRGSNAHVRYTDRNEVTELSMRQPPLNRPEAKFAALIPIRKSSQWWQMSQDERRRIFEEQSHHISMSMDYLPAIARRLYQSRELGEPFDFLTWFEFAPEHEDQFNELLLKLRSSKEWEFVEREIDIRLSGKTGL
jgi:chlorite dismutase